MHINSTPTLYIWFTLCVTQHVVPRYITVIIQSHQMYADLIYMVDGICYSICSTSIYDCVHSYQLYADPYDISVYIITSVLHPYVILA